MPFSSRAVSISTKVAVGSALPFVVHLPIAGGHALIEQNGPTMPHTFAGGASTSMLFVTEAAEAAPAPMLKSAAEAIVVLIRVSFTPLIALCRRAHAHSTTWRAVRRGVLKTYATFMIFSFLDLNSLKTS